MRLFAASTVLANHELTLFSLPCRCLYVIFAVPLWHHLTCCLIRKYLVTTWLHYAECLLSRFSSESSVTRESRGARVVGTVLGDSFVMLIIGGGAAAPPGL